MPLEQKGIFISYQSAEAIELIGKFDLNTYEGKLNAEKALNELKNEWLKDTLPGTNIKIGDKIAGMQDITIEELMELSTLAKQVETYTLENAGAFQYILVTNENGDYDFDFEKMDKIATLARKNNKKIIIDSAIVFGDVFPYKIENLDKEIIAKLIGEYTRKLTEKYGDVIERIDVLNAIFKRGEVSNGNNCEEFWIKTFGDNYAQKIIDIVRNNIDFNKHNIKLCWNEFYLTYNKYEQRKKDFLNKIKSINGLDVIGIQDKFMSGENVDYIIQSLDEITSVSKDNNKEVCITEFSCSASSNDLKNCDTKTINFKIQKIINAVKDYSSINDNIKRIEGRICDKFDYNYKDLKDLGFEISTTGRKKINDETKITSYGEILTPETLSQMQDALNISVKKYLEFIKNEYGSYMATEQLAFMAKLETQSLIKVEDNPNAFLEMQRKEILSNPNLSDLEKKQQLSELTVPLAHGGRVYGDDIIHFYPSVLINPNEPLTLEQIQSKCDSLVVHELLHYFIRPEYMDISNSPELKGINGFTAEGLVDMCARDIHLKYGIHAEDYDSNYTTNVVFMREALSHISDPTERMKTIFTNSVEEVYSKTTAENYDSKKEYEKTAKKETTFQKTISEISGLMPEHKSALEHKLMEIAANSESKEKAIETIQTMGSQEQNQAIKKIVEKNNVEKIETHDEILRMGSAGTKKPEFKITKEKKEKREQAQNNFGEMSPKKQEVYKQQKETTKANNESKTVDKPKTLTLNKPSNPNNTNSSNGSSNSGGFVNMAFMISIILLTSIAVVLFAYHLISG